MMSISKYFFLNFNSLCIFILSYKFPGGSLSQRTRFRESKIDITRRTGGGGSLLESQPRLSGNSNSNNNSSRSPRLLDKRNVFDFSGRRLLPIKGGYVVAVQANSLLKWWLWVCLPSKKKEAFDQCFGSGLDPDSTRSVDPDPGGQK